MSEIDENGKVLASFTDVKLPLHLSLDLTGHVLVADHDSHQILLLSSRLELELVLFDTNSEVKLWRPERVYYNDVTSQLDVLHCSNSDRSWSPDVISQFSLR